MRTIAVTSAILPVIPMDFSRVKKPFSGMALLMAMIEVAPVLAMSEMTPVLPVGPGFPLLIANLNDVGSMRHSRGLSRS